MLPNVSRYLVLSSSLQKTAERVSLPTCCPHRPWQLPVMGTAHQRCTQWLGDRNTQTITSGTTWSFLIPNFHCFVHCATAVLKNNWAGLISWRRKLLIFLTSFSEEDLYFLASSSGVYQLVLQSQAKVFLQPGRSLTWSWAAMFHRTLQPLL